jgi:hypothetical protein
MIQEVEFDSKTAEVEYYANQKGNKQIALFTNTMQIYTNQTVDRFEAFLFINGECDGLIHISRGEREHRFPVYLGSKEIVVN